VWLERPTRRDSRNVAEGLRQDQTVKPSNDQDEKKKKCGQQKKQTAAASYIKTTSSGVVPKKMRSGKREMATVPDSTHLFGKHSNVCSRKRNTIIWVP